MSKTLTLQQHLTTGEKLKQSQDLIEEIWQMLQDCYPATKLKNENKRLQQASQLLAELRCDLDEKLFAEQAAADPYQYSVTIYFGAPSDREQNRLKAGL